MWDPFWLASFVAVADTLSFTKAAERLGSRQPTISDHVRKLEKQCGRRLFVRDTHSVTLTRDGEAMLAFATSILSLNARAVRHFVDDEMRGRIRLGVSEDVVLSGLPQALRRFIREHPGVDLELTVGLSEDMRARLESGALDLAFLKRRTGETHGELVWREPIVWIAARDFTLDEERPLPLVALAPPSLTRSAAIAALEGQGRRWQVVCTSSSQSGVHAAVAAGLGVAPHAQSLVPPGLVELRGSDLPALGETEFVVIGGKSARAGPTRALASMIQASGSVLRGRGSLHLSY